MFNTLVKKMMPKMSPHMRELGFRITQLQDGHAVGTLPYAPTLVGDPTSGVLHGGVVTTLLDSTAGAAVVSAIGKPVVIATLDLRIDYLRPSTPQQALWARVHCYKVTHHVAFVRGSADNGEQDDPVAAVAGTFMLNTQKRRVRE